jgi:hypothetical protein
LGAVKVCELELTEEDDIKLICIVVGIVEHLPLVEVDNLREGKEDFDCLNIKLTENRVIVL